MPETLDQAETCCDDLLSVAAFNELKIQLQAQISDLADGRA